MATAEPAQTYDPVAEFEKFINGLFNNKEFNLFLVPEALDPQYWQNYIASYG